MKYPGRLGKITSQLVMREPFFTVIHLGLEPVEMKGLGTLATDGKHFYYDPAALDKWDDKECLGVFVHEDMHVALEHPFRRGNRDPKLWNIACDIEVNHRLIKAGYTLPAGALQDPAMEGLCAEEIYSRKLKEQEKEKPKAKGDGQGKGQGKGQPSNQPAEPSNEPSQDQPKAGQPQGKPEESDFGQVWDYPGDEAEKKEARDKQKITNLQAVKAGKSQGKLPRGMETLVESLLVPKKDWRDETREFVNDLCDAESTWSRPNRRFLTQGLHLPSNRSWKVGTIVVAIDTSGSTSQWQREFLGHCQSILDECKPKKVIMIQCDARVDLVKELEAGDSVEPKLTGGGGTSFVPVFECIANMDEEIACLIYLTDGYGTFPKREPNYPTIWASTTSEVKYPFGKVVRVCNV